MKISIITVSFNSAETIEETIQSVLKQAYPDIEYIVVDGKSKDGTLASIKKHESGISTWVSEPDKGIYDAMNKGIARSTGEVVGVLNSDDLYRDQHVITEVAQLFENPAVDAVYADLEYVDQKDTKKVKRKWVSGYYQKGDFLKGWMPPHPTFFVRRTYYEKFGGFNTEFTSAADYELMLRFIHKHELNLAYLPRTIIKMRTGGKSNASFKNRMVANKEDRLAWKVNGLKPAPFTHIRKPLSKLGQFLKR